MSVKITDKPTATSMSTADKIFANIGGALKQITKEMFLKDTHDKIDQVNSNLSDLKMLGWSVPKECPIQNEVNGNQFVQKVGRVDLGSLEWFYNSTTNNKLFYSKDNTNKVKTGTIKAFCFDYKISASVSTSSDENFITPHESDHNVTYLFNTKGYESIQALKQNLQGVYFYYEIENPITQTIDGNEIITKLKSDLADLTARIISLEGK